MKFDILPIFSKPIFITILDLSKLQKKTISEVIDEEEFVNSAVNQNYNNEVSLSGKNIKILNKNKLHFLKTKILDVFSYYKNEILSFYNNDFDITTSWLTKTNFNQSSNFHKHSNSMFSGIYYHNVSEKTGDICFENFNDTNFQIIPKNYNIYNSKQISLTPKINSVIIFPSEIYHKIKQNNSKDIRHSLAFNILPIGNMGEGDSKINLSWKT